MQPLGTCWRSTSRKELWWFPTSSCACKICRTSHRRLTVLFCIFFSVDKNNMFPFSSNIPTAGLTLLGGPAHCMEIRGDWKWIREAFHIAAHWGGDKFCHMCVARRNGLNRSLSINYGIVFKKFEYESGPYVDPKWLVFTQLRNITTFVLLAYFLLFVVTLDSWVWRWTQITKHFRRRSTADALTNCFRQVIRNI